MEQVTKLKRTWNLVPVLQIVQKIPENYCPWLYLSIGKVWWLNELWLKRYIQKCTPSHVNTLPLLLQSCDSWIFVEENPDRTKKKTNTHHEVTDLVNHRMVQNAETWMSWEWNITFPQNKKCSYFFWPVNKFKFSLLNKLNLKELWNCILCIICMWSLLCLISLCNFCLYK